MMPNQINEPGVDRQVRLFLSDYKDGQKYVERYLDLIRSPEYLTRRGDKQKSSSPRTEPMRGRE